jgi:hypothetical protein
VCPNGVRGREVGGRGVGGGGYIVCFEEGDISFKFIEEITI